MMIHRLRFSRLFHNYININRLFFILLFLYKSINAHSIVFYEIRPDGEGIHSLMGVMDDLDYRFSNGFKEDCIVFFEDGTYYLSDPITWKINTNGYSIDFRAKEGVVPVISGGKKITGWEIDKRRTGVIKAFVNEDVHSLWIGDKRMKLADGIGYALSILDRNENNEELKGIVFEKKEIPAFNDISGLRIRYNNSWRSYCFIVESIIDGSLIPGLEDDQVLVVIKNFDVALAQTPKMEWIGVGHNHPYYFENSLDLLNEPGEWCYSPSDSTIRYYCKDDESPENIDAIFPSLQNIICIESKSNAKLKNLSFHGLKFSHANWSWPYENGFIPIQGSVYKIDNEMIDLIPAAVTIEGVKNVRFENCIFSNLAANGINLRNNIDSIYIENSEFLDLSGTAISMSDPYHICYSDTVFPVRNITINNNIISDIGVEYASCSAIEAFYTESLIISHNELFNCPYTGISVGWGWSVEPNNQKNVKIINNKIIGDTQRCCDGGAIYSLSHFGDDGLLIQGNYIDEITNSSVASTEGAIYADQGSSNVRINNNVVLSERKWFYYNQSGKVNVDTAYVLPQNHNNYGGWDSLSGKTEINYQDDGEHIFDLPNEFADQIIQNAGIQKKDSIDSDKLYNIGEDEAPSFLLKSTAEGLKIVPCRNLEETIFIVRLYGVDGRLIKTSTLEKDTPIIIDGIAKGFHIIEISSNNRKDVFRVSI